MESPNKITNNEPLSRIMEKILEKTGNRLMPELVPGISRGTILESDMDVAIVKLNPTRRNWYLFLTKKGFIDDGERLINIHDNDWAIRYAIARSFSGVSIAYDLKVSADMFNMDSFICFPEAMAHIIKTGFLDCTVNWSRIDYLDVWATLDYIEHYPDKAAGNINVFYWHGLIDRNGILRGKLELRKDDKHTYQR